jgi:broad specificity phosphatase PhoE
LGGQIPVLLTSPTGRARQTADILVADLKRRLMDRDDREALDPTLDARLLETNFGELEKQPLSEMARLYPSFVSHWRPAKGRWTDFAHRFPAGESRCDVMNRVASLLDSIAEQYSDRTVVLVTHSECLLALRVVLGQADQDQGKIVGDTLSFSNAKPLWLLGGP